jgi:hypothetical protein
MRSLFFAIALALSAATMASAELQTAVVLLRTPSAGVEPHVSFFLDGIAEAGLSDLSALLSRLQSVTGQGSSIFLWIDADDLTPWNSIQQVIDAARKNEWIQIKSMRAGIFIRSSGSQGV